jgi:hypothetical protein
MANKLPTTYRGWFNLFQPVLQFQPHLTSAEIRIAALIAMTEENNGGIEAAIEFLEKCEEE